MKEPWSVLLPLVLAQWIAVIVFAQVVVHNGWFFYQGGDQTFFWTGAWSIAHGHVPESNIGYGWSYLLSPLALVFGANVVSGLPVVILLQTLVGLPVAMLAAYGIAARIGGRLIGYLGAVLWVAGPYLVIPLWDQRYHEKYVEQYLPQALGMSGLGDFPSMVFLLVAAYFCVRAIDSRAPLDGVLAGVAAGFAVGIKPANLLFLAGPALGFLLARRFRVATAFGISLLPALLALALWKYRGLGNLPVITPTPKPIPVAAGASLTLADGGSALGFLSRYIDLDWELLRNNMAQMREFFWSPRALEWVAVAGLLGAARRSLAKAALLGAWLLAFVVVKGSSPAASIEEGTFLRLFLPGLPPFVLLTAAIPLLAPRYGPLIAAHLPAPLPRLRWRSPAVLAAIAVLAVAPILLFAVLPPLKSPTAPKYFENNTLVPVDPNLHLRAVKRVRGVLVLWEKPKHSPAGVFFRVFRSPAVKRAPDPTYPPGREGIRCLEEGIYRGAADCRLEMDVLGTTRGRLFFDRTAGPGKWSYRVGLAANWNDDPDAGDVLVVSEAATVDTRLPLG